MQRKVLVIESHSLTRRVLKDVLQEFEYLAIEVTTTTNPHDLDEYDCPCAVLLDYDLPNSTALEISSKIKHHWPQTVIIAITGNAVSDNFPDTGQNECFALFAKPINRDCLRRTVLKGLAVKHCNVQIIGQSPPALTMLDFIGNAAANDAPVLLEGESGTGKELMAKMIYAVSNRNTGPFVAVNCGAINPNLIESELFGHEKGAFTGAVERKLGRFERANGGTLFLDEIGELSLMDQVKLLRALQERRIERVGGKKEIPIDTRIIAAANRDVWAEVSAGNFRQDLYFRLAVMTFKLPSLRERKDDIPMLARHFLALHSRRLGKRIPRLTSEAEVELMTYSWPGNIRELENVIQRTIAFDHEEEIKAESIAFQAKYKGQVASDSGSIAFNPQNQNDLLLPAGVNFNDLALSDKQELIKKALSQCYGDRVKAAKLLRLSSRHTLYRLMKKFNIDSEI